MAWLPFVSGIQTPRAGRRGLRLCPSQREAWDSRGDLDRFDEDVLFGNRQSVLAEGFDIKDDRLTDILNPFLDGLALRPAARKDRTENVVTPLAFFFENYRVTMSHASPLLTY